MMLMMVSRRELLRGGRTSGYWALASLAAYTAVSPALAKSAQGSFRSMSDWMDAWTGVRARDPVGGLYVYRFKEPMWAILRPIAWEANAGSPGSDKLRRVDVPEGFVTDFASIPAAFFSVLRPDGNYTYAAVIHDFLYWEQSRPRAEADQIFRLAMADFDIDFRTADIIYAAVRKFGGNAWRANLAAKTAGEKRILRRFPEDPRITWADWKTRDDVFKS